MVLPCRDFCIEFTENCQEYIPNEIKAQLDCDKLATEADGPSACISKPGKSIETLREALLANSFFALNSVLNKQNVLFLLKSIKFMQIYHT